MPEQPMPTTPGPNTPCVQDWLLDYFDMEHVSMNPRTKHTIIKEIAERRDHSIATYGQALHPHNGRDALRDAFEEALDLVMYLGQLDLEWNSAPTDGIFAPEPLYDIEADPARDDTPYSATFRDAVQVLCNLVVLTHLRGDKS